MFGPEDFLEATNVSRETLEKFKRYAELLAEWQAKINVIGPATAGDVWGRHFYDSAQLLPLVLKSTPGRGPRTWLDMGSGAGFPGLSAEQVERFERAHPETLGAAARIAGTTPAALTALLGYVKRTALKKTA